MTENDEVNVPDVSYESVRVVQFNHEEGWISVARHSVVTPSSDGYENANVDMLPEDIDPSERSNEAVVGGVDMLKLGAFSEDTSEAMSGARRVRIRPDRTKIEFSPDSSHLYPSLRFRERNDELVAVLTFKRSV